MTASAIDPYRQSSVIEDPTERAGPASHSASTTLGAAQIDHSVVTSQERSLAR
jgi:hypothetical protein